MTRYVFGNGIIVRSMAAELMLSSLLDSIPINIVTLSDVSTAEARVHLYVW